MSAVEAVEQALDLYVADLGRRGLDPGGVRTKTLACLIDVPSSDMSAKLQSYRVTQARDGAPTRYVIACEGYGRQARWRILAKPGTDPKVVSEARRSQALWIAKDMVKRTLTDVIHEINPALRGKELDQRIEAATKFLTTQVVAISDLVSEVLAGEAA